MILSVLAALLTALGPILEGSSGAGAQAFLHLTTVLGLCLWLSFRVFIGHIPLPSNRTLLWVGLLAALGAISVAMSPVHYMARHEWYNVVDALWLFAAMAALSKDQRSRIDEAIRLSGWVLMVLAFYQHFGLEELRPASTFSNENVYAGAVLLFLPLALEKKDWLLAAGLTWSLWWTRSVGAWLGLSLALVLTQRRRGSAISWAGKAVALVCAVAVYAKLGAPEVLHRWWWWKAAAAMTVDRPAWGYGPGAFAYVLPAYLPARSGGLYSAYAHQYILEIAAECGLLFAAVWFAGLWHCIVRNTSHKRFGVVAALIHSMWDYALFVPSNLWLFSYFAASSIPDSPEGLNIRARYKPWAILGILGLGAVVSWRTFNEWEGTRLEVEGRQALQAGDWGRAGRSLSEAGFRVPDDPEVPRLQAELAMRRAQKDASIAAPEAWREAASALERAVRLNPYRASGWTALEFVYRQIGRPDLEQKARMESRAFQSGL